MPLVVFTLVFTLAETSMLPGKLPALDLEVADAMQDELEDISHRGVVDRTWVAIDHAPENLLLAFGVVDGGPRLCLEIPELPYSLLYFGICHRIWNCTSVGFRHQKNSRGQQSGSHPTLVARPGKGA